MVEFRFGKSEIIARRKTYATALMFMGVGLGLGALAGLLTAPKSGKQLRKDVQRKAEEARDAVEHLGKRATDLIERGEELAEAAARKAEPVTRIFRRA
jgi:gas vesicle protein